MGFLLKFFSALLTLLVLLHTRLSLDTNGEAMNKCIARERKALLLFKHGIDADSVVLSTWREGDDEDCCNWKGVCCSKQTGHVQILDLHGSDDYPLYLIGTVNITLLSELHDLKHLDLSYNAFYPNEIPESIELFTNLRYLNLSNSGFVGSIPNQIGKLSNLIYIDLSYNNLDGAIPWQIGNLFKLQYLNLRDNHLVGVIPYQLGNLSLLHTLKLGGQYSNLTIVDKNNRNAEWISELSSLTNLDLSYVSDVGHSRMIGKLVPKLRELRLSGCGISYTDNFPLFASPLNYSSSLVILDLSNNNLNSSSLFQWLFNFNSSLQQLYLSNCSLSSDNLIFTSFNPNLTSLARLDLSNNHLTSSTIFYWISNFTFNLHEVELSYNTLSGSIPDSFGNIMNSLQALDLFSNSLQGAVPTSLGNMCTLKSLNLGYNNLSGDLRSFISNASWCSRHQLQRLDLGGNRLTGTLPNLLVFPFLQTFDLSVNQLTGKIPESFESLSQLKHLWLSDNNLDGIITESHFKNLSNLLDLSLSRNALKISTSWIPPFHVQSIDLAS